MVPGGYEVAVAFGAGAGDTVELHVVVDGQADDGWLGNYSATIRQV